MTTTSEYIWERILSNLSLTFRKTLSKNVRVCNLEVGLNELHKSERIIIVTCNIVYFEYSGDLVTVLRYFRAGFWVSLDLHRSRFDFIFLNENEYFDV